MPSSDKGAQLVSNGLSLLTVTLKMSFQCSNESVQAVDRTKHRQMKTSLHSTNDQLQDDLLLPVMIQVNQSVPWKTTPELIRRIRRACTMRMKL